MLGEHAVDQTVAVPGAAARLEQEVALDADRRRRAAREPAHLPAEAAADLCARGPMGSSAFGQRQTTQERVGASERDGVCAWRVVSLRRSHGRLGSWLL